MTDAEKTARAAVRRLAPGMRRSLAKESNRQWFRQQLEEAQKPIEWLVAAAREGDSDAFDLLREQAKAAREMGQTVPRDLHEFVWELFIDGKPHAPPGRSPKDRVLRNLLITSLVKIVATDFGFKPTRERDGSGISACKIVADELCAADASITERGVEEAWLAAKEHSGN